MSRSAGLKEAANWLRRQANAEKEPKARAAFIEAHNAILALAEGRTESVPIPQIVLRPATSRRKEAK